MTMSAFDACTTIAKHREEGALAVTTMGSMVVWPSVAGSDLNISSVPMMGGAAALGLGLALTQPDRQVLVLDGDGSLLMQLGSLVTIARQAPTNLIHFILDNGIWYSTGGFLEHPGTNRVDYAALALAAGYTHAHQATTVAELGESLPKWFAEDGPTLIRLEIDNLTNDGPPPAYGPDTLQPFMPDNQTTRMGDEGRALRIALSAN